MFSSLASSTSVYALKVAIRRARHLISPTTSQEMHILLKLVAGSQYNKTGGKAVKCPTTQLGCRWEDFRAWCAALGCSEPLFGLPG